MRVEAFEYAIKKDVRNNPIVREVDRERHRELLRTIYFGLFLVAVLVFSVWRLFLLDHHAGRLGELERDLANEQRENVRLKDDLQRLSSPARISKYAREQLHMVDPDPGDQLIIERTGPGSPPPGTAMAQR